MYRYVANQPTNLIDPNGLQAKNPPTAPYTPGMTDEDFEADLDRLAQTWDTLTPAQRKKMADMLRKMREMGGILAALAEEAFRKQVVFQNGQFPVGIPTDPSTINDRPKVLVSPDAPLFGAARAASNNVKIGNVTIPKLGDEVPPKGDLGNMVLIGHELGHAILQMTDFFDEASLVEAASEEIMRLNGGKIPKFGTANPGGLNYIIEALIRIQLEQIRRKTYIGSQIPDTMKMPLAEEDRKRQKEEMERLVKFMKAYGLDMLLKDFLNPPQMGN